MGVLDKYEVTANPPKVRAQRAKIAPLDAIRKKFISGVERQKAQAKIWKPGARDLRSWVTRDEARDLAWVTVKYGARTVPVKGTTRSTIGPVKINQVSRVFDDIKKAAQAGDLDAGLKKVAIQGPRKKKRAKPAKA